MIQDHRWVALAAAADDAATLSLNRIIGASWYCPRIDIDADKICHHGVGWVQMEATAAMCAGGIVWGIDRRSAVGAGALLQRVHLLGTDDW